ncbi:MAG: hypothetical protein ACHREM_28630, partial [Polyangiales bacterium]
RCDINSGTDALGNGDCQAGLVCRQGTGQSAGTTICCPPIGQSTDDGNCSGSSGPTDAGTDTGAPADTGVVDTGVIDTGTKDAASADADATVAETSSSDATDAETASSETSSETAASETAATDADAATSD